MTTLQCNQVISIPKLFKYFNNCWNLSNDLNKQKILLLTDKLLQANMAASSGLRENVYPIIFIAKMLVYIILFYYYIVVILA